jgi:tripartite-type tricarboxylate transporter receptor subunit TctC
MTRISSKLWLVMAAICLALPPAVYSQAFPTKPMKIVVAIAGSDYVARLVALKLTESLGQPVVVETQTGAGGMMGAEMVAHAGPDGHTLLLASVSQHVMRLYIARSTPYDPVKDFAPITMVGETLQCIVVNSTLPVNSLREFIDYARGNPGRISYATSGIGTGNHLSGVLIGQLTGIEMIHVPFKTGAQATTSVVGGQVPMAFAILATAMPQLRAGKLKVLAVVNDARYHGMPDIPSVREVVPGFQAPPYWFGFFTRSGTPQPVIARLHTEIVKIITPPDVRAKLDEIGFAVIANSPEEFAARIRRDMEVVSKVVKAANIQPE